MGRFGDTILVHPSVGRRSRQTSRWLQWLLPTSARRSGWRGAVNLLGRAIAGALLISALSAVPAAAAHQASWSYDPPIGASPDPSPATCPTSSTTGNRVKSTIDDVSLHGSGNEVGPIEQAVTHVESLGGGVVVLPRGTWTIDSGVGVDSNVTLEGQGEGETTLKAGATFLRSKGPFGGYPMVYAHDSTNVTVEGLTLDQQGQRLNADSVAGRLNEMMLEDAYSRNVLFYDVETEDPFSYSIGELVATRFCFSGDTTQVNTSGLYDQLDGFHMTNGSDGDLTDDYADQCNGTDGDDAIALQAWGGSVSHIDISDDIACSGSETTLKFAETEKDDSIHDVLADDNTFADSAGGVYAAYYPDGGSIYDVNIVDNTFDGVGPADLVDIEPPADGRVHNTLVEGNAYCESGSFLLARGAGNIQHGNHPDRDQLLSCTLPVGVAPLDP
jgi:hypothetical protein